MLCDRRRQLVGSRSASVALAAEFIRSGAAALGAIGHVRQRGKVVAVGPGRMTDEGDRIKVEVKVGDEILFGKWSGSEITIDGDEYLFMKDDDILAVL